MIQKQLIDLIVSRTKIAQRDLIEKDLILHRLLIELSSRKLFFDNYAFKGGTCLMKCYLGYYRFSEDLDFTYIHQYEFEKKSGKQIRRLLSEKISLLMKDLKEISAHIGLDFKGAKSDRHYIEFGGSNRQATFKLWYTPDSSSQVTFIKIQANFLEKIECPVVEHSAYNFFLKDFSDKFLLPDNSEWVLKIPKLRCYDIREILIEKIRAILTRRSIKVRDYIDVYMIEKKERLDVRNFKRQIIEKVRVVMKLEKYMTNITGKSDFTFNRGNEERILLVPLPKDADIFFHKLKEFLVEIIEEV